MIFALRHPAVLLGLVLGFLIGIPLRAAAQRAIAGGTSRRPRAQLHQVGSQRSGPSWRPAGGWSTYFDPYGAVAAALSGVGWGSRQPVRRNSRFGDVLMLVAALVVHGALAVAGFAALNAAGVDYRVFAHIDATTILHGGGTFGKFDQDVAAGFAMVNLGCGLLALWPIPPLELGVVLWTRLPRTPGAQRMAYHVLEEQWGVAIALLFLLLPLVGQQPLLLTLINDVSAAIFGQF